ncbi:MAG: hypothetical protein UT38_C0022G0013 [Microgenomates group bacterium GW2011_GWA2_39_19]|nr:MAG: hypothetical protein UT38_C0022G0013 [Microgenomates group bacterium GW2011_GWA2_39_19]
MRRITTDHFTINIKHRESTTHLFMHMLSPTLYTDQLPHTYKFLMTHLPCIYKSKCFNHSKVPFKKEVKDTEIAHLFEHILLEHLRLEKESRGCKSACFSGETRWDWSKNPCGTFHIKVGVKHAELEVFSKAFEKSINLFMSLLDSTKLMHQRPAVAQN